MKGIKTEKAMGRDLFKGRETMKKISKLNGRHLKKKVTKFDRRETKRAKKMASKTI